MNPNETFYPGDGFHYLFEYSGSDTCISFNVNTIKSGGAVDVLSHNIWSDFGLSQEHIHENYKIIPKYITTTHYYVDNISYSNCGNSRCSEIISSETPSFSIREDQTIPNKLKNLLDGQRTASTYSLRTEVTNSWDLTKEKSNHSHNEHSHIFEDASSRVSFDTLISQKCSGLKKNQGCVFGHTEINPNIVNRVCLIKELQKRGIDTTNVKEECMDNTNDLSITATGYKKIILT